MKRYILLFYLFIVTLSFFSSCQDFLSASPESTFDVYIDNEEKIAELLTGAYPQASYCSFLEARTDNVEERVKGVHNRLNEAMYFWEDYDQEDLDTPLNYWLSCYNGIAQVNDVLQLLAKYPKTPRVKALYGEAFLLRAYLHFMLVNIWSEPYSPQNANKSLGIPYLTNPEKNALVKYERGTVKEVYDKIEKDLKLGITLVNDDYYSNPKYHFNKKAAYAFATRFYLMKGEWELVVKYADYVLGYDAKKMLRNWVKLEGKARQLSSLYTQVKEPANLLLTATESRYSRLLPIEKYGTTFSNVTKIFDGKGIEGCEDAKKLKQRTQFPFLYGQQGIVDGAYLEKFDELALFESLGNKPRNLYVTNVLFTADEVMLNRMEAYAMLREYDKAVEDLQDFMESKYDIHLSCPIESYLWTSNANYTIFTPFYGLTLKQMALIKTFLDFRQKEFLHEGLRWFDIRRFYLPVKRNSKSRLYRPLEKEDPRKVLQIPAEAIQQGLTPNLRYEAERYHP